MGMSGGTGSEEKEEDKKFLEFLRPLVVIFGVILLTVIMWNAPPYNAFNNRVNEDNSYETLIEKTARIKLYNGGKVVEEFDEATIIFASPKSATIQFEAGGKKYLWQDGILIELKGIMP